MNTFDMVTYKEFSSLTHDLGISGKALYSASYHINEHYKPVSIAKSNGELRQLHIPDKFLKTIQRRINDKLLPLEEISPFGTAYRPGGSTKRNSLPHVGKPVVLKLDIRHFFDSIIYPVVKEKAFPKERYSEKNRILLTLLCIYKDALPQGAPTSPAISNIIMKEFDNTVGEYCLQRNISFTRYCDDMTFSGDFDPIPVITLLKKELKKMGLFLNDKKTVIVRKGQKHSVTGIIVNEKLSIPTEYKRHIRQEMYYCKKYGVQSHVDKIKNNLSVEKYARGLLGRINYVLSIEPDNVEMKEYKGWLSKKY